MGKRREPSSSSSGEINDEKRREKRKKKEGAGVGASAPSAANAPSASSAPHPESDVKREDADLASYATRKIALAESFGRAGGVYIPPFKLARMQALTCGRSGRGERLCASHWHQRRTLARREQIPRTCRMPCVDEPDTS